MPEFMRDLWMEHMTCFKKVRDFLKHPDWRIHTKAKDGSRKLYTRVSDTPLFCIKSIALIREDY